jgi:hypothetical protein
MSKSYTSSPRKRLVACSGTALHYYTVFPSSLYILHYSCLTAVRNPYVIRTNCCVRFHFRLPPKLPHYTQAVLAF